MRAAKMVMCSLVMRQSSAALSVNGDVESTLGIESSLQGSSVRVILLD